MTIRLATKSDYPMLCSWWRAAGEPEPTEDMIPLESTFIYERGGVGVLSISMIIPNIKEYCMLENLVGNPEVKDRETAVEALDKMVTAIAREYGFKRLFCLAYRPAVKRYYKMLGFTETLSGVSTFTRGV